MTAPHLRANPASAHESVDEGGSGAGSWPDTAGPTYDEPTLGWTVVLRRQPVRLVAGRAEGGYADAYELVCCDCGDDPDVDYRDVSKRLQRIRGPYRFSAGITAYGRHVRLRHGQ